jgi:hypothetical protein
VDGRKRADTSSILVWNGLVETMRRTGVERATADVDAVDQLVESADLGLAPIQEQGRRRDIIPAARAPGQRRAATHWW